MAEKAFFPFFFGKKRGFRHFVLHVKRRRRWPEVKRPFDLYWWEELNFGQEPVFFKRPYFKLFPEKLFLTTTMFTIFMFVYTMFYIFLEEEIKFYPIPSTLER